MAKTYFLTRSEGNKSFSKCSSDNAKKFPQYPELKAMPKNCCGLIQFSDVTIRLKTTPGLLLSPTSRLFPLEDGPTDCVVRLSIHGKGLDKMDTMGLSDPYFEIWKLKHDGIIRPAPGDIDISGTTQDDLTQYEQVYKSEYIEHTLDPKFPTFVLPS